MWVTLDFEASGLSDASYPIEVGYCLPDGNSISLIINPDSSPEGWQYWDEFAEKEIHGISRQQLVTQGVSVLDVCTHLNNALCYYDDVLCDSQWDLFWLGRLYKAAHMRPTFTLTEVGHWLRDKEGVCREDFLSALDALGPAPHRAEPDAQYIRRALSSVLKEKVHVSS
ncbi:hypothetical protein [Enterovibrio norvegicus]|uniref:Exonuclease domain-containing protein n=1 Tax=Enterovibrio norvegicus TaxID=188144 RepID=A0A2N7LFK4_9GAMM|nr:hypothetical protein [Enterovibrio norvegicus]MCC4796694.1 hypothetical protein [Enterovibrio norvegicus]PMH71924.1 hypothetical protein BCU62_24155 [Enterovibrio norvegicus]PMI35792.1 hypothetical protein BCU46_16210 [Enterovibrio norvegicus]PML77319.1 hypothetical protein BCT69_19970 [Enterovibrio norvegicus]PMN45334.1 hypothetical protein BCT30_23500 [Enterovibrio norvegicus]